MSVSILGALENAEYNLCQGSKTTMNWLVGKNQLHNAVELLGKGYGLDDDIDALLSKYGSVDEVPDKEEANGKD